MTRLLDRSAGHGAIETGIGEAAHPGAQRAAIEFNAESDEFLGQSVWLSWRFNLRLQVVWARYWLAREDVERARTHAERGLEAAREVDHYKYIASSEHVLGDIALVGGRPDESRRHFDAALRTLARSQCPGVEWRVLRSAGALAAELRDDALRSDYLARSAAIRHTLATTIADDRLKRRLLST